MKLLETEWVVYRNKVIGREAGDTQLQESRRAFFGGAWAFYALVMKHLQAGDDPVQGLNLLMKLHEEMCEFEERVLKGWA